MNIANNIKIEHKTIILKTVNDQYASAHKIFKKVKLSNPNLTKIPIYSALIQLTKLHLIKQKKDGDNYYYRLTCSTDNVPTQKIIRPISKILISYLKNNIGKKFTVSEICKALGYSTSSNTYGSLNDLVKSNYVSVNELQPRYYTALPLIKSYGKANIVTNDSTEDLAINGNNNKNMTNKAELIIKPEILRPIEIDHHPINISDTINSIVELEKQLNIYKSALETVASILEQAGIIESE